MKFLLALLFVLQTVLPAYAGTGKVIQTDNIESIKATKNYINNGLAQVNTTGWSTYADAAGTRPVDGTSGTPNVTWTRSTTSPLSDAGSFIFTKDAANRQGQGASFDFTIDSKDKAKVLKIEADYIVNSGTFAAGSSTTDSDVIVYIYDVTNSVLIEPSSFKLLSNSSTIADKFSATFQTSATGTQYRLIFHVASTSASAYSLKLDNVSVSPSQYVYGTPITDEVAWTPTLTNAGNATVTATRQQIGDNIRLTYTITIGSSLPTGTIIFSKPTDVSFGYTGPTSIPGASAKGVANATGATYHGTVRWDNANQRFDILGGNGQAFWNATVPFTWSSGDIISIEIQAKVVGWSSSTQVSDGYEGRQVTATMGLSGNQAIATTAETKVTLNSSILDKAGMVDTTNNRIKIKSSGTYMVSAAGYFNAVTAGQFIQLVVKKNGSTAVSAGLRYSGGTDEGLVVPAIPVDLVADDYLEMFATSGDSSYSIFASAAATYLSVTKLPGSPTISATPLTVYSRSTSAGQTLNASVESYIDFGTAYIDSMGGHIASSGSYNAATGAWSTTNPGYRVQEAGTLDVTAMVTIVYGTSTGYYSTLSIYKNSTKIHEFLDNGTTGGITVAKSSVVSGLVDVIAGDIIYIKAVNGAAANKNLDTTAVRNTISIKKVK